MSFRLDTPSRRIAFAIGISLLLHGLMLWTPDIHLPRFQSSLPALTARLEALPSAPPRPKAKHKPKTRPAAPKSAPVKDQSAQNTALLQSPPAASAPVAASAVAASTPVAASAPAETETIANANQTVDRPPLPKYAQLTFAIYNGTTSFRIGEAVHTLEIKDGHYVLQAVTKTVGLVSLFKSYELSQFSSGSYNQYGLQPEQFLEKRIERSGTQSHAVEFDRKSQHAFFAPGGETPLPPDTQDILSVLYQFPPLAHTEMTTVSVCNGKKIEQYKFEIAVDETIDTPLGKMLTVHLRKMRAPDEEGLDIWLAREYRLFPVKLRFIERNGEVTGEAVITDIRVSDEQGVRSNAVN
ncbi:DUF3108 domain-containing protein [Sideroxydans lithotrophicus]|uniref:DUF3108 domain-containing protein n=1 Tax=Sideroxydans lithotrophicus (strain ES-1) TaxID=580332 RepID=D5CQ14_SIDLE|nr:DUF3108 domain-containing protein [Sideroxydans lithotrophicus]ADE11178.1 conserved hypothetical protein [Sideroxydans lithotrophicus ES-1]